ncbi:WhiB family transcriptional regulator [Corynebacteriaceae bacterium 7-707]
MTAPTLTPCKYGHDAADRYKLAGGHLRCRECDRISRLPSQRRTRIRAGQEKGRAEWLPRAACQTADPDAFDIGMNVSSGTPAARRIDQVWDQGVICESCPVVRECAADAITMGDIGVVRGGVPVAAHCDLAWRRLENAALTAMSRSEDPVETRRVWREAWHRTARKRRDAKKAP